MPASGSKVASVQDTSGSLGLHDTLSYGPRSLAAEVQSVSVVKDRLERVCIPLFYRYARLTSCDQWDETQDNLQLNMLRNAQGLHAPMRLLMERKIVGYVRFSIASVVSLPSRCLQNPHMPTYQSYNVHLDILMGRDETITPGDFMTPGERATLKHACIYLDVLLASQMTQPLDIHAEMEKKLRM